MVILVFKNESKPIGFEPLIRQEKLLESTIFSLWDLVAYVNTIAWRETGEQAARRNRKRKQAGANLEQIELRQDKVCAANRCNTY